MYMTYAYLASQRKGSIENINLEEDDLRLNSEYQQLVDSLQAGSYNNISDSVKSTTSKEIGRKE